MYRHVLYPPHHRGGIHAIVRIHEISARVPNRVVGKKTVCYHGIQSLLSVNFDDAFAFLVLPHYHLYLFSIPLQGDIGSACTRVYISFHIPHLTIIDGAILQESNLPVTGLLVPPVRGEQHLMTFLHGADTTYSESTFCIPFNEVEHLCIPWQRFEMQHHVKPAIFLCLSWFVKFNSFGPHYGEAPVPDPQTRSTEKAEIVTGIVRPLPHCQEHAGHRVLQLHTCHINGYMEETVTIARAIFRHRAVPHRHLLRTYCCKLHCCSKPQQANQSCRAAPHESGYHCKNHHFHLELKVRNYILFI